MEANIENRIDKIECRLSKKAQVLDEHSIDIEVLKTNILHLTKSINSLTKSLWAMCSTVVGVLIAFFIWYIQKL